MRKETINKQVGVDSISARKGITLVSLIITIVILLILAGISISMLIGDHGIIKRAQEAGRNYEEAAKYEEEQLAKLYQMIENPDKYDPDEIIGETEKVIKDLQEQIDKLEQEKEDKENEIKQKDETIADLNQIIEDLRKQIEDLENEKKELIANNNALQEEIASKAAQIDDLNKQIGELQNTISNLQEEIANKNNQIEELNRQIAQQQETIRNLQEQINNLNSILSQTNATANQILTGKKAYSGGKLLTGTMPNRGAVKQTLNAGGSYTIPEGYHNGSGKVTAKDLASQTVATATQNDIAQGKTAWVNGVIVTGTSTHGKAKVTKFTSPYARTTSVYINISSVPGYSSMVLWQDIFVFPRHVYKYGRMGKYTNYLWV